MFGLSEIFFTGILIAGIFYWWHANGVKDLAIAATRNHCNKLDVQFLDDTLVLKKLRLTRESGGIPMFLRSYYFEFTATGSDRNVGHTTIIGQRVTSIKLEPHRLPPSVGLG